jgi:hypothetical protein
MKQSVISPSFILSSYTFTNIRCTGWVKFYRPSENTHF